MISTGQKFSRKRGARRLMVKNLLSSLILYEKLETTSAKIKAIKSLIEKILQKTKSTQDLITLRRYLSKYFTTQNPIDKIINVYKPNLVSQNKLINVYKIKKRKGDGALIGLIVINPEITKIKFEKKESNKTEKVDNKKK